MLAGTLVLPICSVAQEAVLFFKHDNVLYRVHSTGTGLQQISVESVNEPVRAVSSDPITQYVYWIQSGVSVQTSSIWRVPAGGGDHEFVTGSYAFDDVYLGIDVDETTRRLYWSSSRNDGTILRSNLDGSGVTDIVTMAGPGIFAVQVEPPYVYWTTDGTMPGDGSIRRTPASGGIVEELVSGLAEPRDLVIDPGAGKMYWTELTAGLIRRANLTDGSNVETVAQGLSGPFGLALDSFADRLYWTENSAGAIRRKTLTTGHVQTVIQGLAGPGDVHAIPIVATPAFGVAAFACGLAMVSIMAWWGLRKGRYAAADSERHREN